MQWTAIFLRLVKMKPEKRRASNIKILRKIFPKAFPAATGSRQQPTPAEEETTRKIFKDLGNILDYVLKIAQTRSAPIESGLAGLLCAFAIFYTEVHDSVACAFVSYQMAMIYHFAGRYVQAEEAMVYWLDWLREDEVGHGVFVEMRIFHGALLAIQCKFAEAKDIYEDYAVGCFRHIPELSYCLQQTAFARLTIELAVMATSAGAERARWAERSIESLDVILSGTAMTSDVHKGVGGYLFCQLGPLLVDVVTLHQSAAASGGCYSTADWIKVRGYIQGFLDLCVAHSKSVRRNPMKGHIRAVASGLKAFMKSPGDSVKFCRVLSKEAEANKGAKWMTVCYERKLEARAFRLNKSKHNTDLTSYFTDIGAEIEVVMMGAGA
ncbi:hypothetical protein HK101_001506 [Irineochytrium annulatum]|nr:hypothetical protein HK101_001506 [Irineochytrium annulatum]